MNSASSDLVFVAGREPKRPQGEWRRKLSLIINDPNDLALEDLDEVDESGEPPRWRTLTESLRKANDLSQQMVGVLDSFEQRLTNLQKNIAPIHNLTKKLTTVNMNLDQAHGQLSNIISYFELADNVRTLIMTASISAELPEYLAAMDRLADALSFLSKYKFKPSEKAFIAMRALHRTGFDRLKIEFRNTFDQAALPVDAAMEIIQKQVQNAVSLAPATKKSGPQASMLQSPSTCEILIDTEILPTIIELTKYLSSAEDILISLKAVSGDSNTGFMSENSMASYHSGASDTQDSGVTLNANPISAAIDKAAAAVIASARVAYLQRLLSSLWTSSTLSSTALPSISSSPLRKKRNDFVSMSFSSTSRADALATMSAISSSNSSSLRARSTTINIGDLHDRRKSAGEDKEKSGSASSTTLNTVNVSAYAVVAYDKGSHPLISYLQQVIILLKAERELIEQLLQATSSSSLTKAVFESLLTPAVQDIVNKGETVQLRAKRAVYNHDFSELLVFFDLIENLTAHQEELESFALYCGKVSSDVNELIWSLRSSAVILLTQLVEDMTRPLKPSSLPLDGTVHELTSNTINFLQRIVEYRTTCESLLRTITSMAIPEPPQPNQPTTILGNFIVTVLDALSRSLETQAPRVYKSRPLEAIFLLNNYHYILKYLKEPAVATMVTNGVIARYVEYLSIQTDSYQTSWKTVIEYLLEVNAGRALISGVLNTDKAKIKEKFKGFNTAFEELYRAQQSYSIPDADLRQQTRQTIINLIIPLYSKFLDRYSQANFTKNPDKYIKFKPQELENMLLKFFDVAA